MLTEKIRNESYQKIKPTIGHRQMEVYTLLMKRPMSAWEISTTLGRQVYVVRPRITELARLGAIEACGTTYCETTQRHESVWRLKGSNFDENGQGRLI